MDELLEEPILDPFEQPPLVQAVLVALHTLVVHNGMEVTNEGDTWKLDFVPQIKQMKASLKTAGIDADKEMLAPVRWADDADDADEADDADDFESVGPDAGDSA